MKTCFPFVCLFSCLFALHSFAGNATWNLDPTNADWNTADNWTPETVPNSETDVATFGQSHVTDIAVSQTVLGSLVFGPDASSYTFTLSDPTEVAYFAFYGDGVINNSPNGQTFVFPGNSLYAVNVEFRNTATAGDRATYYASNGGSGIFFAESSNAGSATFIVSSFMDFYGGGTQTPSAANATIINDPGYTTFSFGGTAGNAVITNGHGGRTDFENGGDAGNATITNEGTVGADGWQSQTYLGGSAGTVTIINNPATVQGGQGGATYYGTEGLSGDSPTIINNGSSFPADDTAGQILISGFDALAGNPTLIAHGGINGGAGGGIIFEDKYADGGAARVKLDGNGYLDISLRIRIPVSIGSVEGKGEIFLGANNLGIGANNLSTEFSGHIQDGNRNNRTGGSITKFGSGTLTLTGANTYTGGTTVTDGALLVSNTKGSGTGTGPVQVNAGTIGGGGIVAGTLSVGTGTGAGAFLAPANGSKTPATFTTQGALTCNADATYTGTFRAKNKQAQSDRVVANGVTINGAALSLRGTVKGSLKEGLVLTLISNTSATPISGTFSNLPDGALVNVNGTNFQASYTGGDGNDLTLTVVP